MKKNDKLEVIKWYIKKYINISKSINIESINSLKEAEEVVRTGQNVFAKVSRCNQCTSDGKSNCSRCANCLEWHWDLDIPESECKDNYRFRYQYWKTFFELDGKNQLEWKPEFRYPLKLRVADLNMCEWKRNSAFPETINNPHVSERENIATTKFCPYCGKKIKIVN